MTARFFLVLFLLGAAIGVALYYPTFRSAWAFDDFEYINTSAGVLAGKISLLPSLIGGHDEHFVPAFRILLFGYLKLFGLDVFAWRVMTMLAYALSGVFVAMLAWRYTGSRRAALTAMIVYVAPCGFSSMWMWFSSGAAVPLAFVALNAACAVVAWRDRLRLRRIAAGVLVLLGLMTWAVFAPFALLPAIVDELERRREGARGVIGAFTMYCIGAMLFVLLVPLWLINEGKRIDLWQGSLRALYLTVVAPFRFLFPGIVIASDDGRATGLLGAALGIAVGAAALALLAGLWRRGLPRLAVLGLLTAIPGLAYFAFVGIGRAKVSLEPLYDADRYFFPLLIPIALLAGAIAASISLEGWTRTARATLAFGLIAFAACEIGLHRRALLRRIPREVYEMHGNRFASLERLADRLQKAGPIAIPDNILWFDDVHSHLDAAVLTHILSDGKRVRLGGPIDEPRLNAQLDAWAREIGEPLPFLRVVHGHLVNLHFTTTVDFSIAPFDKQVVSGFHEWERPYRWMTRRGELDLMLAPADLTLRLAAPFSGSPIPVRVTLVDDAWGGYTAPLGTIEIKGPGVHTYKIPESLVITKVGLGRIVRIVLECDRVSRGPDGRERTIQVYAFGTDYLGDTGATVKVPLLN